MLATIDPQLDTNHTISASMPPPHRSEVSSSTRPIISTTPFNVSQQSTDKIGAIPSPLSCSRLTRQYRVLARLGQGASGTVYQALRLRDRRLVAVKCILRSRVPSNRLAIDTDVPAGSPQPYVVLPMEVYILRRLQHPSIVRLLDYFEDRHYFFMITELAGDFSWNGPATGKAASSPRYMSAGSQVSDDSMAPHGGCDKLESRDLFECLENRGTLSPAIVLHIMRQLVSVACYLKSMNVYHMDFKDENVVINRDYEIKLVDFGSAHILPPDHAPLQRFYGTVEYAPPEVLRKQPYQPEQADIWAMGSLMYTMLNGQVPFSTPQQTLSGKFNCNHTDKKRSNASAVMAVAAITAESNESSSSSSSSSVLDESLIDQCQSIIHNMLCVDSRKRVTLDELADRLNSIQVDL